MPAPAIAARTSHARIRRMTQLSRRGFLSGLFAAPAIIALDRLMPVKALAFLRSPTVLFVDSALPRGASGLVFPTLAAAIRDSIAGDSIIVAPRHTETVPSGGYVIDRPTTITGGRYFSTTPDPIFRVKQSGQLTLGSAQLSQSWESTAAASVGASSDRREPIGGGRRTPMGLDG